MADLNIDMSGIKPLLSSLGLGKDQYKPLPNVSPTPPPGPPPPTPAQAGFSLWSADPRTQQSVANTLTPPGQPIIPPAPTYRPLTSPGNPFADVKPLPGAAPPAAPPAVPSPAALPTSAPTPQEAQQTRMRMDMTANPDQYQKPVLANRGTVGNILNIAQAGLIGAAGGIGNRDPLAGVKWVGQQDEIDRGVPAANAATYDLRNVKPLRDAAAAQQATANLQHTEAQTKDIGVKSQQQLARYGLKTVTDPATGAVSTVPDTDSPIYKQQQDKEAKLQAQTQLIGAQIDSTKAQKELRDAQAALAASKNDPNSAAYKQANARLRIAQQNANAATTRATAYMGNYMKSAYNTGLNGETLAGAPIISDDNGNQSVVGATNAGTAIKNQSNAAQFNDVHGALDSVEQAAQALVSKGGKLNSPGVAAALSQPKGTLGQWLQGAGVKANLTPEERSYVQSIASAHENIQALRKSAGGTATDSAVEKLDAMIPGISTPDLNYLKGQTGQIRATAERLGKGATVASGGLTVRGHGKGTPTSDLITVQIPGQAPGQIHASQKAAFLKKYPNAKVQ